MAKSQEKVVRSTMWSAGCGSHGGCGAEVYVENVPKSSHTMTSVIFALL